MKKEKLKPTEFPVCAKCGKPAAPIFYRVRIEQFVLDMQSVERAAGMSLILGGRPAIVDAMSPDIESTLLQSWTGAICVPCQWELLLVAGQLEHTDESPDIDLQRAIDGSAEGGE